MKAEQRENRPTIPEIENELDRLRIKHKRRNGVVYVLIAALLAAALIILATNLWFPVLKIVGTSMQPTIESDEVVLCSSIFSKVERGDVIAFYNNDRILVKRVLGLPGDTVNIDSAGVVSVNGEPQTETYVLALSLEPCDITFPVQVPNDAYFVLGDRRTTSMDSRSESIGMITEDKVVGTVLFRVWPFNKLSPIA